MVPWIRKNNLSGVTACSITTRSQLASMFVMVVVPVMGNHEPPVNELDCKGEYVSPLFLRRMNSYRILGVGVLIETSADRPTVPVPGTSVRTSGPEASRLKAYLRRLVTPS